MRGFSNHRRNCNNNNSSNLKNSLAKHQTSDLCEASQICGGGRGFKLLGSLGLRVSLPLFRRSPVVYSFKRRPPNEDHSQTSNFSDLSDFLGLRVSPHRRRSPTASSAVHPTKTTARIPSHLCFASPPPQIREERRRDREMEREERKNEFFIFLLIYLIFSF